jgi:NTP pyrophosphatase (non-canonical NTP hydrolase)
MDLNKYQKEAFKTDQVKGQGEKSIVVPLLGLAGEAGSLLTEYKKRFRDGKAYKIFDERLAEELGDILWYIANIATKSGLALDDIANQNLEKVRERWQSISDLDTTPKGYKLFDEAFALEEQLPRKFTVSLEEVKLPNTVKVTLIMNGVQIGGRLTDNTYEEDGYRFHDAFHLAYAAILGWSPTIRSFMKRKRKSNPKIDEVEDGGRAIAIEEAISALVFNYAKTYCYFENVHSIDYEMLRTIKNLVSHLEVARCSTGEWAYAILEGFKVWRQLLVTGRGKIVGDLIARTIYFENMTSEDNSCYTALQTSHIL